MQGKKLLIITARGDSYPKDTPYFAYDMQEPYLRLIFGFMGITDIEVIHADNLMGGDDARQQSLTAAKTAIYHAIGVALFSRYGVGTYCNTAFDNVTLNYWMTGVAFPDLFKPGAIAGIAAGQPIIATEIGNATQTNFEAFYNFPINDNIRITPTVQVITNAGNQDANGTIVTGTIRTVFLF